MKSLFLLIACALSFVAQNARADDAAADLAVIVNKASKLSDVTSVDLAKYFKADKTKTPDGTKLVIVMQDPGHGAREAALKDIFKMSEEAYNEHFVEATFTGAVAAAPKSLPSAAAVKKFVAETPGAIGYVHASEADDSVKVLKVDGQAPGEAKYGLKIK
jgi:ABC-type phosphate transport system substrate-binding protein